jgi:hypothetical protein
VEQEHPLNCSWHRDWHACSCGAFDVKEENKMTNFYILTDNTGELRKGFGSDASMIAIDVFSKLLSDSAPNARPFSLLQMQDGKLVEVKKYGC